MENLWYSGKEFPQRVVVIEYEKRRPVSVITEEHWDHSKKPWFVPGRGLPTGTCPQHYDFNFSKRDASLYWHNSGGGGGLKYIALKFSEPSPPPGEIWIADDVPVFKYGKRLKEIAIDDAELLKLGYRRLKNPRLLSDSYSEVKSRNPFDASTEGRCIYCDYCRDHLLEDSLCEHIDWCGECAGFVYLKSKIWVEDSQSVCQHEGERA
jgi:hypothetical protein